MKTKQPPKNSGKKYKTICLLENVKNKEITVYSQNKSLLNGEAAANEMNSYYSKVGKKWLRSLLIPGTRNMFRVLHCPPEMHFRFVGEKEVVALVKSLETNKSSQVSDISTFFLKYALLAIVPEVCHLINECLRTCFFLCVFFIEYQFRYKNSSSIGVDFMIKLKN